MPNPHAEVAKSQNETARSRSPGRSRDETHRYRIAASKDAPTPIAPKNPHAWLALLN